MKFLVSIACIFFCWLSLSYGQAWNQRGSDIDGEAADNYSGYSVSLSNDGATVAIGAHRNSDGGSLAGHVRVYSWNGSSWSQKGIDIDGEAAGDHSGISVSLSSDGDVVAIGAWGNAGTATNAGHVRVYSWNGSAWSQKGGDMDGEAAEDRSGYSVSLSADGDNVAIGAYGNDGNGSRAGHVRVYSYSGGSWSQKGSDIDGEAADDDSGYSVKINNDGTVVVIGARFNDGTGSDAGHVRVYYWNAGSWSQRGSDIDAEAAGDRYGYAVSSSWSADTIAIGGPQNDGNGSNSGHVRVYRWNSSAWVQLGSDIDGEASGDNCGGSVDMSNDGSTIVVGASGNDDGGTGAGHVRSFEWNGSTWDQKGGDVDGEAASDQFGFAVAISGDAAVLAGGSWSNDDGGSNAGHTRIYAFSAVLPVVWKDFQAIRSENGHVECRWETAVEFDNDYFVVERSINGIDFEPVGVVNQSSSITHEHQYTLIDERSHYCLSYYRVKQVDLNGAYSYSSIVSVPAWHLNPVIISQSPSSGFIRITVSGNVVDAQLRMTDLAGNVIYDDWVRDMDIITIPFNGPAGLYLISIRFSNGIHSVNKVILQ